MVNELASVLGVWSRACVCARVSRNSINRSIDRQSSIAFSFSDVCADFFFIGLASPCCLSPFVSCFESSCNSIRQFFLWLLLFVFFFCFAPFDERETQAKTKDHIVFSLQNESHSYGQCTYFFHRLSFHLWMHQMPICSTHFHLFFTLSTACVRITEDAWNLEYIS